jgi:protoheme IX farnesyltransferase
MGVALAGTALVAAGASALNMLFERRTDALMLRTRNRPVAAGRLRTAEALAFGLALTLAGLGVFASERGPCPRSSRS